MGVALLTSGRAGLTLTLLLIKQPRNAFYRRYPNRIKGGRKYVGTLTAHN